MLKRFSKRSNPQSKIKRYLRNGRIAWSEGYIEYKAHFISDIINSPSQINNFRTRHLTNLFGIGLDERCVEYPWIFSKLSLERTKLLDAGSTFNFSYIVDHNTIEKKDLTIYTFYPEHDCFFQKKISYVFGDLRDMYFKNETFDEIVCQSTIEHIDMDNSIYGYSDFNNNGEKSFEYIKAIFELIRILKVEGKMLITFPYGKFENHGFFQQFDSHMLDKLLKTLSLKGESNIDFFKYEKDGWHFTDRQALTDVNSYNPHTGRGKGDDGAAHCRGIVCIEFIKHRR